MLKSIEKFWPMVSTLSILVILAFQFVWPANIRPLSLIVMGIGLAAMIAFTIQRHLSAHREKRIEQHALAPSPTPTPVPVPAPTPDPQIPTGTPLP
jgi:hypothetical protein